MIPLKSMLKMYSTVQKVFFIIHLGPFKYVLSRLQPHIHHIHPGLLYMIVVEPEAPRGKLRRYGDDMNPPLRKATPTWESNLGPS